MQAIATVCANPAHTSRIRRIARRQNLPVIFILGRQVFVPPDKPEESGSMHFDSSLDGIALVSSLREQFKRLKVEEVQYYPPSDPRLHIYETALRSAAKRRRPKIRIVIAGSNPASQPS